ncbi:Cullin-associated NEDD8-dissociated protein 1 [Monascus purpureus]|uniref:Cullin-associated NEDD8-dissociated protein 1 n=1 Tax=Monascus purpureus TaxID=5098 RepID=A0A507QJU4_MONPU|nr:Cullin-associated NEDD8-dissociated protein 1 [Monascus purpureus]
MPPSEYASQLKFLKNSADFLIAESPSTSAHLLAVHRQILHDNSRSLNQRQHETFCGACGSIRKPEWTKIIHITRRNKAKRSDQAVPSVSKESAGEITVYKCLRCHRKTVKPRQGEPTRQISSSRTTVSSFQQSMPTTSSSTTGKNAAQVAAATVEATKTADNASSKKRAKARKQGSLQALLASKQRSQAASSSSLDIFDFLQQ